MSDTTFKNLLPENVEPTAGSNGKTGILIIAFALAVYVGVQVTGFADTFSKARRAGNVVLESGGSTIGPFGPTIEAVEAAAVVMGNSFPALVYAPYIDEAEAEAIQARSPAEKQFDRGAAIYRIRCSGCHQSKGEGSPSQGAPPLDGSEWVTQKGPGVLVGIVNNGLSGAIVVKGKTWSQGVMSDVGASLTDDELADLLMYIRNAWSNSGAPVDSAEVAEIRESIGDRDKAWTAQELEAFTTGESK